MAPSLAWKLQRLMAAANLTQAELAAGAGINQGNLSSILSGKQRSLRPETAERLAAALADLADLEVPAVYFLSDRPRDYVATKLAGLSPTRLDELRSWTLQRRLFWLLADLAEKWGEPFAPAAVADALDIGADTLAAMAREDQPLTTAMAARLAAYIGVPAEFFLVTGAPHSAAEPDAPAQVPPADFLALGHLAWSLGLDPALAAQCIRLLAAARDRPL